MLEAGETRAQKLAEASEASRLEMEDLSARVRDLILACPTTDLLGYLWVQLLMGSQPAAENEHGPDKDVLIQFQFALEYVHAVWVCHPSPEQQPAFEEKIVKDLLEAMEMLREVTMNYCMASSAASQNKEFGDSSSDVEFHAKFSWVMLRGHRYQVLEEEFLRFALAPHDSELRAVYGADANEIAKGVQDIADSMRGGFGKAAGNLIDLQERAAKLASEKDLELGAAIDAIQAADKNYTPAVQEAILGVFHGGFCNVTKHTKLPALLLRDLAFERGENKEFYAAGAFAGTPLRTLPARVRPLVKLGEEYYATDPSFVRDFSYRAVQRGLCGRNPAYREVWNAKQKVLAETALPTILARQLAGATVWQDVYYRDAATGEWTETDSVLIVDDVLVVAEAKAGVTAMHSPATNFERHVRTIKKLVLAAYNQTRRFLTYCESGPEVPLYRLEAGAYVEVGKIRLKDFRMVLPIGLTMESFSPFSTFCKELPEIEPILGRYPFVSLSADDLFVLNRLLPTAGELFHYFEVRQQVAGIRKAMLYDEFDHLGAYVAKNRFDFILKDQLKEADEVMWDAFSDSIDAYFMAEGWEQQPPPRQSMPPEAQAILDALDRSKPLGWLKCETYIRNLDDDGRTNLATIVGNLVPTLVQYPQRRFVLSGDVPMQFWLTRSGSPPNPEILRHKGEVACLALNVSRMPAIVLQITPQGGIEHASCCELRAPSMLQLNYPQLLEEAKKEAKRATAIPRPKKKR